MSTCPRCGLDLEMATHVSAGEILLHVEQRVLYRVTESTRDRDQGKWAVAERLRPRPHDPEPWTVAVWPDSMRAGKWLRVANPAAEDALGKDASNG